MARGLNVFVNIGAKVASSVGASASAVERRLARMGQRLKLANAEAKAASRGLMSSGDIRGAAFDIGAIGFGFYQATKPALEFEDALVRLGNTGETYGPKLAGLGDQIVSTGKKYGVGGRAALTGVEAYVAAGLTLDQAIAALDDTLKFSRTLGIDPTEGAAAGVGVMNNMGIAAKDVGLAFDRMALAGKKGNFEVSAMAKYMPRLTSAAAKMGMTGVEGVGDIASMLQVVRKGSADEETAQNNLYNLFEKTFSGETVKKFKKGGYDLTKMWATSRKTGQDYFEMILDATDKMSKGGENPFAFSATFEDQQAKSALSMLIEKRAEYRKLRDEVRGAGKVVDQDWNRVNATAASRLKALGAKIESVAIKLGDALLPPLTDAVDGIGKMVDNFAAFAKQHPQVTKGIVNLGLALGGLAVGAKIASILGTGLMRIAIAGRWLWTVMRPAAAAMGAFRAAAIPLFEVLVWAGIPVAAAVGTVALAIAALAAGIAWIIAKKDGFIAFFQGFGDGIMKNLSPETREMLWTFGESIKVFGSIIANAIGPLVKMVGDFFAMIFGPPKTDNWRAFGEEMGKIVAGIIDSFAFLVKMIGKVHTAISNPLSLGKPPLEDLSGGGGAMNYGGTFSGTRAKGGHVRRGGIYQVNERGQELFAPGASGTIIPARQSAAMMAGGGGEVSATFNIYGATDPDAVSVAVERKFRELARQQRGLLSD